MSRPAHKTLAAAIVAATTLALTACAGSSGGQAAGVDLVKSGKLTVCTHLSFKPFQYKDNSGQVVGFDVDLMDLAAKKMGVTQEIVDIDFASIQSGAVFAAKKCDAAAGAITINDKRKQAVLFSDPYFNATQELLVKKGSGIKSLTDLKGKKLGVQTNTTGQEYAQKYAAEGGYEIVVFDDSTTTLNGALSGRVAASLNDNTVIDLFVQENPTMEVGASFNTGEQYGIVLQKDNANATKLAGIVNDAIKTAKSDGTYVQMYKKYFGKEPAELP